MDVDRLEELLVAERPGEDEEARIMGVCYDAGRSDQHPVAQSN